MTPATVIRTLEVATIVASWFAAAWLFRRVTVQKTRSLSYHGGTGPRTYPIFGLTLSTHAVVFTAFIYIWLIPTYELGPAFAIAATLGAVMQFLTAWIRDGHNLTLHRWHTVAAYSMAATMPVILGLLLANGHLSRAPTVVISMALISMVVLLFLSISEKSTRAHYLWYQSAYILTFQLAIIAVAISH